MGNEGSELTSVFMAVVNLDGSLFWEICELLEGKIYWRVFGGYCWWIGLAR